MTENDFASHAIRIVREAAAIARNGFGRASILREKRHHDLVTEADLGVEQYIVDALAMLYPGHGFYAEEQGKTRADAEYVWILDPIDGTKYYARGVPMYSISLALQKNGVLILGIVFSPQTDQLFQAESGCGAQLNGNPIRCSKLTQLEDAIVCVEIPNRDSEPDELRWGLERLQRLIPRARRVRNLGISALSLSYCAMGGFDAYVNLASLSQYYDVAAGQLIVKEAGATLRCEDRVIIAGPSELVHEIATLIRG